MDEKTLSTSKTTKRAMHATIDETRHFTVTFVAGMKRPNLYGKRSIRCWPVLSHWSNHC